MGAIFRNGKPYSGSSNNADNIKYGDNTVGTTLKSLEGRKDWGISEVTCTLPSTTGTWTQIGSLPIYQTRVHFVTTTIEPGDGTQYINIGVKIYFKYNNIYAMIDDAGFAGKTCKVRCLTN